MGMKTISGVVITTVLLGAVTAFAHSPCGEMPQMPPPSPRWECGPQPPPLPPMPPAVRDQVEELLDAEQTTALPLMQKLQNNRRALRKAAAKRPFDEAAVAVLAKEQAAVQTELLVMRLLTQSRIRQAVGQR